jgi:hypothetical protein
MSKLVVVDICRRFHRVRAYVCDSFRSSRNTDVERLQLNHPVCTELNPEQIVKTPSKGLTHERYACWKAVHLLLVLRARWVCYVSHIIRRRWTERMYAFVELRKAALRFHRLDICCIC